MSLDRLREAAAVMHTYSDGLCPDEVSGAASRDPECRACQTIDALLDVAEAAALVAGPGFDIAEKAALNDALARLREVQP